MTIDIAAIHPRIGSPELPCPARKTDQAGGCDCCAAIYEPLELWPGRPVKVPLAFALGLPEGWKAQIPPRSGLAAKGLIMPNIPGTADSDYRDEVSALLFHPPQKQEPGTPVSDVFIRWPEKPGRSGPGGKGHGPLWPFEQHNAMRCGLFDEAWYR